MYQQDARRHMTEEEMEAEIDRVGTHGTVGLGRLIRLGRDGNHVAARRVSDHYLSRNDIFNALLWLDVATRSGDAEAFERAMSEPAFDEGVGCSLMQRTVYWTGWHHIPGFDGFAQDLALRDPHAAGVMALCVRSRDSMQDEYDLYLEAALRGGSPAAMHARASDLLRGGFGGWHVPRVDEALDLMERASATYWRSAVVLGMIEYTGRYVERDIGSSIERMRHACSLTDSPPPRSWLNCLAEEVSDDPGITEIHEAPEWHVLTDITASWSGDTMYRMFTNGWAGFDNGVFSTYTASPTGCAPQPRLLHRPSGFRVEHRPGGGYRLEPQVTMAEARKILRECIASAADSIRGLGNVPPRVHFRDGRARGAAGQPMHRQRRHRSHGRGPSRVRDAGEAPDRHVPDEDRSRGQGSAEGEPRGTRDDTRAGGGDPHGRDTEGPGLRQGRVRSDLHGGDALEAECGGWEPGRPPRGGSRRRPARRFGIPRIVCSATGLRGPHRLDRGV